MERTKNTARFTLGFTTLEAGIMLILLTVFSLVSISVFKKGLPVNQPSAVDEWKAQGGDAAVIKSRTISVDEQRDLNAIPPPIREGQAPPPSATPGLDGESVVR